MIIKPAGAATLEQVTASVRNFFPDADSNPFLE